MAVEGGLILHAVQDNTTVTWSLPRLNRDERCHCHSPVSETESVTSQRNLLHRHTLSPQIRGTDVDEEIFFVKKKGMATFLTLKASLQWKFLKKLWKHCFRKKNYIIKRSYCLSKLCSHYKCNFKNCKPSKA